MKELLQAIRADDRAAARRSLSRWPEFAKKPQVVLEAARFERAGILELRLSAGADPNAACRTYRQGRRTRSRSYAHPPPEPGGALLDGL